MRIAMVGQKGIPATYGGIERHVEEIGARLVERGHEVTVYARPALHEARRDLPRDADPADCPSINTKHFDTITHCMLSMVDALFRQLRHRPLPRAWTEPLLRDSALSPDADGGHRPRTRLAAGQVGAASPPGSCGSASVRRSASPIGRSSSRRRCRSTSADRYKTRDGRDPQRHEPRRPAPAEQDPQVRARPAPLHPLRGAARSREGLPSPAGGLHAGSRPTRSW